MAIFRRNPCDKCGWIFACDECSEIYDKLDQRLKNRNI